MKAFEIILIVIGSWIAVSMIVACLFGDGSVEADKTTGTNDGSGMVSIAIHSGDGGGGDGGGGGGCGGGGGGGGGD